MKKLMYSLLFLGLSFQLAAQNEFIGVWQLTDTEGDEFKLKINADHTAESTYNKGENAYFIEIGFWRMHGEDLHVMFNNGWLDVLQKEKKGYTKTAYAPGKEVNKKNGNSSPATKLSSKSIWNQIPMETFVGKWELYDENNKPFYLQVKADYSAQTTYADGPSGIFGEHGTWRYEEDRILITYDSGWVDVITKVGEKFHKVAYAPGQRMYTKPNNKSIAKKEKVLKKKN